MVKLSCAFVGEKSEAFSVEIDESKDVRGLMEATKSTRNSGSSTAEKLLLYVAKTSNGEWLRSESEDATQLYDGKTTAFIQAMTHENNALAEDTSIGDLLRGAPDLAPGQIHIVAVIMETPSSDATMTQPIALPQSIPLMELFKKAVNNALDERERRSEVAIATCARSDAEKLLDQLGFEYDTVDVVEERDGSIPPYAWLDNLAEDHVIQCEGYKRYLRDNLQSVLAPTSQPRYHLKDTSQTSNLLTCDLPGTLSFKLSGTVGLVIIDHVAATMNDVFAGLHFVIDVKKGECGVDDQSRLLCELVSASLKSDKRCAPIGLLTSLADYWYFVWIAEGKVAMRMTIADPANAFAMVREILRPVATSSMKRAHSQLQFPSTRPPKRQKLSKVTTGDDYTGTEVIDS